MKKQYCRPNKILIREINKEGFQKLDLFAFYLILSRLTENGLIFNFKKELKDIASSFSGLSRNTSKKKLQKLIELGWVSHNEKKDILSIKSQDKIRLDYGVKSKRQSDVLIGNSLRELIYRLRAIVIENYTKTKIYKFRKQIGQSKIGNGSTSEPGYVKNSSRNEIAKLNGCRTASSGSKSIKRMKQYGLILKDEANVHLVKEGVSKREFYSAYLKPEVKEHHILSSWGNLYKIESNTVYYQNLYIKCYEK